MNRTLIVLLAFFPLLISAQTILMEENVIGDTIPKKFGPNLKHYTHSYLSFGIILGTIKDPNISLNPGKSFEFNSGFRYKNKLNETLALVAGLSYSTQTFSIRPEKNSLLTFDKEKYKFNTLGLDLLCRVNCGKRGNIIGKYFDVGAYGDLTFTTKHYLRIDNSNNDLSTSKYTEIIEKKLDYFNPIIYGVSARVGWEWLSIYSKYRFSNLSKTTAIFPELPRLILGIELSIIN